MSVKSERDLNDDVAPPDSKRIKIGSSTNGHDGIRNEVMSSSVSRTPSPQVFSKEKVNINGQDYVKPVTTIAARTSTSSTTGLTSLTTNTNTAQPTTRHSIATESMGQTSLTTSTQSAFTPAGVQTTAATKNTLTVGHTGQTSLTTSTLSAFTPPSTPGSGLMLSNNTSMLSNGTRIAATLDSTNNGGFTHSSNGESIEVDDALELLTGPVCQWANCTRYILHVHCTLHRMYMLIIL